MHGTRNKIHFQVFQSTECQQNANLFGWHVIWDERPTLKIKMKEQNLCCRTFLLISIQLIINHPNNEIDGHESERAEGATKEPIYN